MLNYIFSDDSVTLQDLSTGKTIGIGREFQGLFHLNLPSSFTACTSMDTPLLIHSRLGHPTISKFRKMVPHFSSWSLIECESCQLEKHTCVYRPQKAVFFILFFILLYYFIIKKQKKK